MKLNIKKSLASIFSPGQQYDEYSDYDAETEAESRTRKAEKADYEKAYNTSGIPDTLLEKIIEIINRALPEVIQKSIDKEAEKQEVCQHIRPAFMEYINFVAKKICSSEDVKTFDTSVENKEHSDEIEARLNTLSQSEKEYKERFLSAERQRRALADKTQELEQRLEKFEGECQKLKDERAEVNNKYRILLQQKERIEEESEKMRLELDQYRQMQDNENLMQVGETIQSNDYVESLKKSIVKMQTENGELEQQLEAAQAKIEEITASFETALHVKDETVKQAVERETILQARIEALQQQSEGIDPEGKDGEITRRLIDVTRKYQALQLQMSEYKAKMPDEEETEQLKQQVEELTMQLTKIKNASMAAKLHNGEDPTYEQNAELREKIEEYEERERDMQSQLKTSQQEVEELKVRLSCLSDAVVEGMSIQEQEQMKAAMLELQVASKSLENELSAAKSQIEKLKEKSSRQAVAAEKRKETRQIEDLKEKVAAAQKESEKFKREAEVAKLNVVALTNEVEALKGELGKQDVGSSIDIEGEDWMVVMEPETPEEILERKSKELERQRQEEEEKEKIIPFDDPAQMKLW